MASNVLSIGQSALAAAQVGISVTGHNIANASTPGFSRQIIIQSTAQAQNFGFGFIGQGTEISAVRRVYSEILAKQAQSSQSVNAGINVYSTHLSNIDDMLSDAASGLNPAMNDFFASVQDLTASPSDAATRQTMLSNAQSLVNRFQSTGNRLSEISNSINTQITSGVSLVNTYAKQIASLNNVIEKAISANANPPNDLMDQRDQLVLELSKQIKTTVVTQNQSSYNIFIGNGLPLVVGSDTFSLTTASSPTDPSRLEIAYQSQSKTTILGVNSLTGGAIGGLIQFRAESLDSIKNQLGQIAVVLAETFNSQHKLGIDLNGDSGGNLFSIPSPAVSDSIYNTGTAVVTSQFVDARAITSSDYRLQYDGVNYIITRLSDKQSQTFGSLPQTIDGLSFDISSGMVLSGDDFVIRPTTNAATSINLAINDVRKLAIGSSAAPGDNSNGLLLASLQSQGTLNNSKTSYSSAFGQLVNNVGNKTRELKVTGAAEAKVLEQTTAAVQSESGVNLDEEATNLLRYQQAYQAAGKMMQIAGQLFDVLLQLG